MNTAPPRSRRALRFSLRTFLLLVLLLGGILGWQLHIVQRRARLRAWLEFRDAFVLTDRGQYWQNPPDIPHWGEIPWYRRLLGDEPVLKISMPGNVPEESRKRVEQAFPESLVGIEGCDQPLSDSQYAVVKQRAAQEKAYQDAFLKLFNGPAEPSAGELLDFAPLVAEHLSQNAILSVEAEVVTVDFAIQCLRSVAEDRERLGKINQPPGASKAASDQYLSDLEKLQAIVEKQEQAIHSATAREYTERLLDYELARCTARRSLAARDKKEREQAELAIQRADRLCAAAEQALADETITPDALISALELRREARLVAASLTDDEAQRLAAWQQFAEAIAQRLAIVEPRYQQGIPGGEAEKYHLLTFCAAKADASIAKQAGDAAAELAAVMRGANAAQTLVEATRIAHEVETITADLVVDAINRRAAVNRKLAQLQPAAAGTRAWQTEQAAALFVLASKLNAVRFFSDAGYDPCKVEYVTCRYILVRCLPLDKAAP